MTAKKSKRLILKTIQIGVKGTTMADIQEAAEVIGAPEDASIFQTGAPVYNARTNTTDPEYPNSVTFSWPEEI